MKRFIALLFALVVFSAEAAVSTRNNADYTLTSAVATTSSASALAANTYRRYLLIQNNGAVTVYVKFNAVHSSTEGIILVAGASYESLTAPTGAIFLKSASSTAAVTIYEGN